MTTLRDRIIDEIRRAGPIPFSHFMELCLYEPELGYYSRAREQFGKAGDFYTSSDVHAVFGRLLARAFDEMWRTMGSPSALDVVELGPGRGLFAQDVIDWTGKKFPDLHSALRYRLVEQSPTFRCRLEQRFAPAIAAGKVSVHAAPEEVPRATHTVVFANELIDALPVDLIDHRGEVFVGEQNGDFIELFRPPRPELLEYLDRYSVRPEPGERVEACPAGRDYVARIGTLIDSGFVVLIDYGYTQAEQRAGRHRGTITCYRQHSIAESPYDAPGEQDITAHVNFTALCDAAMAAGLSVAGLVTQSQFLIGIGETTQFADAFEDCRLPQERAKVALQLKHLVTPAGMGETFHVLIMDKNVSQDAASQLSGLRFARSAL